MSTTKSSFLRVVTEDISNSFAISFNSVIVFELRELKPCLGCECLWVVSLLSCSINLDVCFFAVLRTSCFFTILLILSSAATSSLTSIFDASSAAFLFFSVVFADFSQPSLLALSLFFATTLFNCSCLLFFLLMRPSPEEVLSCYF